MRREWNPDASNFTVEFIILFYIAFLIRTLDAGVPGAPSASIRDYVAFDLCVFPTLPFLGS